MPSSNDVCGGIEWRGNTTDQTLTGSDNSTSSIANYKTGTSTNGTTNSGTGLIRTGSVAWTSATRTKQTEQPHGDPAQYGMFGFHYFFPTGLDYFKNQQPQHFPA
jgi:hypothetical protein